MYLFNIQFFIIPYFNRNLIY